MVKIKFKNFGAAATGNAFGSGTDTETCMVDLLVVTTINLYVIYFVSKLN